MKLFTKKKSEPSVRQMWDRERAKALTQAERAEIDAIFARYA